MDLKNRGSLSQEQKNIKPRIDDIINDFLSGDALNNALNFIDYLKDNKMSPRWSATSTWTVRHKSRRVCVIKLHGSA